MASERGSFCAHVGLTRATCQAQQMPEKKNHTRAIGLYKKKNIKFHFEPCNFIIISLYTTSSCHMLHFTPEKCSVDDIEL